MNLGQEMAKRFLGSRPLDELETDVKAILPDIPVGHLDRLKSLIDAELIERGHLMTPRVMAVSSHASEI